MFSFEDIIGNCIKIKQVKDIANKIADSDIPVLITGESGTGKELFAQAIHDASRRKDNNFIAINCGTLPDSLIESILFGHVKGSFTNATDNNDGLFLKANNGSIFLDEVGELKRDMQVKLLRVLQEQEIIPIGSTKSIKINVRIISATNASLENMLINNEFREDLYFRLNSFRLNLPPLRERQEDITLLAKHFIKYFNEKEHKSIQGITANAEKKLLDNYWTGNIRELKNAIYRAILLCDKDLIDENDIEDSSFINFYNLEPRSNSIQNINNSEINKLQNISESEKDLILKTIQEYKWNLSNVAKSLGISRSTLYRKIKEFNIK